ncbi:MAG: 8-oxo-dGTP diphosphatase [Patescibacteria group bacterium]|nr:8-oxo-dGTP diphosphatase [Patescibacteria group bacterium]
MKVADVVFIENNKVLLVQQRKEIAKGLWSFPGGAVEEGETSKQAVVREVKEELGALLAHPLFLKSYKIITPRGDLIIDTFMGELKGDIVLKEDELMAYQWFSLTELENNSTLRAEVVIKQARDALNNTPRLNKS